MVQQLSKTEAKEDVIYPDSDGNPMADNTLQFQWIVTIKENIEIINKNNPDVFVAGDLLWYPVEGNNKIRQAPDAMVAIGRPKGYRGSYQQWNEGGIAPQVVFEVLSPGNRRGEMARKLEFYNQYGVEEYYEYDPYNVELVGWQRQNDSLKVIESIADGWVSPRLNIRFDVTPETLKIYRPDGSPFLSPVELDNRLNEANQQLDEANQQLNEANQQLDEANQRLEQEKTKSDRLSARLKELGIDPSSI